MTINGIDVSNYQGAIDWPKVAAAGCAFAVIHCTDGYTVDPWFQTNWDGAKAAGLVRLAYAYVYPQLQQPLASADYFVNTIRPLLEVGDGGMVDAEEGSGDQSGWYLPWLVRATQGLGFKPLIYSRLNLLEEYNLAANAEAGQYGLAIASWGVDAPTLPPAWTFWALWQYSAQGSVAGISGGVDLDRFNGTADQLRAYGLPAKPAPATPTNDDLEQMHRLIDAQPFGADALATYVRKFT